MASTHIGFGYCESGFSSSAAYLTATTSNNNSSVDPSPNVSPDPLFVFGNPGARRFQGFLFTIDKYEKVRKIILKDGSSGSKYNSYSPLMGYSSAAGNFDSYNAKKLGHVIGTSRV